MRSRLILTILCLSVLLGAQIACRAASQVFTGPTQPAPGIQTATPAAAQAITPILPATPTAELAPEAPTAPPPNPEPGERPPQSQAAAIRPPEDRAALTRLSTLLNFTLLDRDGAPLG
ncbi:MAG TPA: hypothetical protein VLS48_02090, partial [Anaerolineales bacterium]|nr:hypothetical protein [Anaerolineales bacterium]